MNGIPKSETLHVTEISASGEVFYITSKENNRDTYYIYQKTDAGVEKLGKGKSPPELEKKFIHRK